MATQTDKSAEPRTPLTRERILRAAISLADEVGIESLSMRKLGQELGVEAMSLYNHVDNKDDILDGMIDIVVGEIDVPSGGTDWKTTMRRRAISAREVLLRHPWAPSLMESRVDVGPARLRYLDSVIGTLREAGFTIALAQRAFLTLDSHIYGFILQELSWPFDNTEELGQVAAVILRELPVDMYPHLHEMVVEHVLKSGPDNDRDFEFGLALILDGLERIRDAA